MIHFNNEIMANSTTTHAFLTHFFFLHKAHHDPLAAGTEDRILVLCLWAFLNSKITNKKYKSVKDMAGSLVDHRRDICFGMRAETRRQGVALSSLVGNVSIGQLTFFPLCAHLWMSLLTVLIWGFKINFSK